MTRTICELSVYDLGGEDSEVWLSKNKQFGFDLEVTLEDGVVYEELGLHPYAAESLADFCRQYLRSYERVTKESAA